MSAAVHFTRIDVQRMPGFPRGGLAVDGLAAGINVVYGPNASGKTTLARAMQRLLRPHADGRHTDLLTAELAVAGQSYDVEYHAGQFVCRSGGRETSFPVSAPAEVGGRNVLALHELIQQEDDHDIVQQILREAAGGYDVRAAAKELGFDRDRPSGRNIKAVKDHDTAVRARKEAEQRLLGIDRDAQQLASLESEREEAHHAQLRQNVIADALDALTKNSQLADAQNAVSDFPEAMSKLIGDEWQRLTDLKKGIEKQREKLAVTESSLDTANRDIQETRLPDEGVSAGLVGTLENCCETLRERARDIHRLESDLEGAEAGLNDALARLGPQVSVDRVASLDAATIDELFKFVRQAENCYVQAETAETLASWLSVVLSAGQNPEILREGILLLQQWLAEERVTASTPKGKGLWFIVAVVTAIVAIGMAFVHTSWLVLLVPAAGLAAWPFIGSRFVKTPTAIQTIPDQWGGLGLSPLREWEAAGVQAELRELQQKWAAAQLSQEKSQRFADLQERRDKYREQEMEVEKKRTQWRDLLGIDIDVNDARLYLFAQAICQVQVAQNRMAITQAELAKVKKQYEGVLKTINDELAAYGETSAADAEEASAQVRDLDQRRQKYRDAVGRRDGAEAKIQECKLQIEELDAELAGLFANFGLTSDDELALRRWTEQFPHYQKAREELGLAEREAKSAVDALVGHEELLQQTREQLQTELDRCRRSAENLKHLDERLGDIRGRVRRAKEETALEAALAAEVARLDELGAARDDDYAHLVGNLLANYVMRQQRDVQQPGVLKRAVELFARITHGRYQLLVEPGDPPGFRARDTSLGREQNLDELSSGTRLQLLLSVRVAFVEQQEQGLQLPLIFDETLGNTDEQRAGKIIEAAIEIAREGRQVFYLTAQFDELGKWRRALRDRTDVSHCEVDLARLRGFSEVEHAPESIDFEPPPHVPVPPPANDDWIAYGLRLHVPSLDRRGHIGGVHLWYLIDDVNELYRLLLHDINKWGQFQTLIDIGAADGFIRESPLFLRASAAARLLENLLRYWRQGRGLPVDRAVLDASGAVSAAFIDEVSQLAESLDGDARQLIESLRSSQVKRFRNDRIEALETYLTEHGYLDDQPILAPSVIREAVVPLVFADCDNGLLSRERVDQLIALVTR
jgi:energy-coupling factor transporter ATP-binding protein EcfA2